MLRSIIEWLTAKQEIEYLKRRVDALEKELSKLEDENKSLWFMLDEIKEEEKAVATALQEELTDELLRNMEPIGRATEKRSRNKYPRIYFTRVRDHLHAWQTNIGLEINLCTK